MRPRTASRAALGAAACGLVVVGGWSALAALGAGVAVVLVAAPPAPRAADALGLRWHASRFVPDRPGVYVLRDGDGRLKIGMSKTSLKRRVAEHMDEAKRSQTIRATSLALAAWAECPDPADVERELHAMWQQCRIRQQGAGIEWFQPDEEMSAWARQITR